MKTNIHKYCRALVLSGVLTFIFPALLCAAEQPSLSPEMAEMMQKAEAVGMPGKPHQVLEPLVGSWDVEVKSWMAPDAPPVLSKGSAEAKWIMGGRFVREDFQSEFMGKPYEGMAVLGFDNLKQKYGHVWIDSFSTAIYFTEGTSADDGKEFIFAGESECPMTEKPQKMKHIIRILNEDEHVLEMYNTTDGANIKVMEITYTRKK